MIMSGSGPIEMSGSDGASTAEKAGEGEGNGEVGHESERVEEAAHHQTGHLK